MAIGVGSGSGGIVIWGVGGGGAAESGEKRGGEKFGVRLEEERGEGRAEECAIHTGVFARGRRVNIPAIRTEELDRVYPGHIYPSTWKDVGGMTEDSGTGAENALLVLVDHTGETSFGEDEALVDETVEQFGGRFDDGDVRDLRGVFFWLDVEHHLQGFFPERDHGL